MYFYDGTVIGTQGAFSSSAGLAEIYGGTFETVACLSMEQARILCTVCCR